MKKRLLFLLFAMLLLQSFLLTACGSSELAGMAADTVTDISPETAAGSPPAAPAEATEELVPVLSLNSQDKTDCVFHAAEADSYGYFHFRCEKTGIYDFSVDDSRAQEWTLFVLENEFTDAERFIPQTAEPLLRGDGTAALYADRWIYIYCPYNEWTGSESPEDAACGLKLNPGKDEKDVTTPAPPQDLVITKDPTDETVREGEITWFVARAEQADSMLWEFISPEGEVYSVKEAESLHKGLTVTTYEDTIQLENIPKSFSGWRCRAVFFRGGLTVSGNPARVTVSKDRPYYLSAYESVIDAYDTVLRRGEDPMGLLTDLDTVKDGKREELYYALRDVNGDNVPELFIAAPYASEDPYWNSVIFSLFTLKDGEPIRVLTSWARDRYTYSDVAGFVHESSSGADSGFCYSEYLNGVSLRIREGVYSEKGKYYYFYGDPEEEKRTEITEAEYAAWQEGYTGAPADLPYAQLFD